MAIVSRGSFVVIVGPDGVGKTSVASALWDRGDVRYFHFRPSRQWIRPEPGETQTKETLPASLPSSIGRLGLNLIRFWSAYLRRVRPALRAGHLVVGDRWGFGYVAKPHELRYSGPAWLARLVIALFPQPDAVICLVAPVETIRRRKQELSPAEIERDLDAWRSVPCRRMIEIQATESPEEIADRILSRINAGNGPAPR